MIDFRYTCLHLAPRQSFRGVVVGSGELRFKVSGKDGGSFVVNGNKPLFHAVRGYVDPNITTNCYHVGTNQCGDKMKVF